MQYGISELKQSVDLLKNSNELLQDAISDEVGSLKDEVKDCLLYTSRCV